MFVVGLNSTIASYSLNHQSFRRYYHDLTTRSHESLTQRFASAETKFVSFFRAFFCDIKWHSSPSEPREVAKGSRDFESNGSNTTSRAIEKPEIMDDKGVS